MKKIFLFLCLSFTLNAQIEFDGVAYATLSDSFADNRVNENCFGLTIQVNSNNANMPLKDVEISILGDPEDNVYKTKKDGKTLIITGTAELSLKISGSSINYEGGSVQNILLEKGKMKELSINLHQKIEEQLVKKPVIYLYSDKELTLDMILKPKGDLSFSYPEYKNGWKLKVLPNAEISVNGRNYPYLFWEGTLWKSKSVSDFNSGFLVKKGETVDFLEEKLSFMGFNQREITDFITFWAPSLETHERNFIHFVCGEDYDEEVAELELSVIPDSEIRINMFFAPVDNNFSIKEQQLRKFERKGFTLVEWGGAKLSVLP